MDSTLKEAPRSYPLLTAAKAAGVKHDNLRVRVRDNVVPFGPGDVRAHKRGATTRITARTIFLAGIAEHLTEIIGTKAAHVAASVFVDLADEGRDPCALYGDNGEDDFTALIAYSDGTARVVPVKATTLHEVLIPSDPALPQSRYEMATVLLLDFIVKGIRERLVEIDGGDG